MLKVLVLSGFFLFTLSVSKSFFLADQEKVPKFPTFSMGQVSLKVQCDAHMQSSF